MMRYLLAACLSLLLIACNWLTSTRSCCPCPVYLLLRNKKWKWVAVDKEREKKKKTDGGKVGKWRESSSRFQPKTSTARTHTQHTESWHGRNGIFESRSPLGRQIMGGGEKNEKKINESNKLEGETKQKMGRQTSFMDNVNFSFLSSNWTSFITIQSSRQIRHRPSTAGSFF